MNPHRRIPADVLLAAIPFAVVALLVGGLPWLVGTVVSAVVTAVNFAVLTWLVEAVVAGMASEKDASLAGAAAVGVGVKMIVAVTAYGVLLLFLEPIPVVLGLAAGLTGACIRGLLWSARIGPSEYAARLNPDVES